MCLLFLDGIYAHDFIYFCIFFYFWQKVNSTENGREVLNTEDAPELQPKCFILDTLKTPFRPAEAHTEFWYTGNYFELKSRFFSLILLLFFFRTKMFFFVLFRKNRNSSDSFRIWSLTLVNCYFLCFWLYFCSTCQN